MVQLPYASVAEVSATAVVVNSLAAILTQFDLLMAELTSVFLEEQDSLRPLQIICPNQQKKLIFSLIYSVQMRFDQSFLRQVRPPLNF